MRHGRVAAADAGELGHGERRLAAVVAVVDDERAQPRGQQELRDDLAQHEHDGRAHVDALLDGRRERQRRQGLVGPAERAHERLGEEHAAAAVRDGVVESNGQVQPGLVRNRVDAPQRPLGVAYDESVLGGASVQLLERGRAGPRGHQRQQ